MASVRRQERGQQQMFSCLTLQTLNGGSKAPPAPGAFQPWPSGVWAGRASSPSRREASARTPSFNPARHIQALLRSYFCPCQRWKKPFGLLNIE